MTRLPCERIDQGVTLAGRPRLLDAVAANAGELDQADHPVDVLAEHEVGRRVGLEHPGSVLSAGSAVTTTANEVTSPAPVSAYSWSSSSTSGTNPASTTW